MRNSYVAYCLDEIVDIFGSHVEFELSKVKRGKNEKDESYRSRVNNRLLQLTGQPGQVKFANPVATK